MCGKGIFWKAKVGGQNGPPSAPRFPAETQLESVFKETPPAVQLLWTAYRNLRCSWLLVSMFFSDIYLRFEGVFRYSVFRSNPFCKAHYGVKAKAPPIFRDHLFQFWMVQNGRIHQRLVVVFVGSCFSTFRKTYLVVVSRILEIVHLKFPDMMQFCVRYVANGAESTN